MKIAFTSTGTHWESIIDHRFGRSEFIVVFDDQTEQIKVIDNTSVKDVAHGAGTATAQKLFELNPSVLITGNGPGGNASTALKQMNVKIFVNAHNLSLKDAYEQYKLGKLQQI